MTLKQSPNKLSIFSWNRHVSYQWDLMRCLVDRNIKVLYKRSFFGIFWMLIKPLLHLSVYAFVFRAIIPVNIPNFTSFLFTGLLFWNWFATSLTQATGVIVYNLALIKQPGFPQIILPIVSVITELTHLLFALPILLLFLLWDKIAIQPVILLLPLIMILQFFFTLSLGYILAAINVIWRDTQHTIGILLQILMYLTGIFYDFRTLPSEYQLLLGINPMIHFLNSYRNIIIDGSQPNWLALFIITVITAIILPLGLRLFQSQSDRFVEEV